MLTDDQLKAACDHYGITIEEGRARMEKIDQAEKDHKPICFVCARYPDEISEYKEMVVGTNQTCDEFVVVEEGTFNPDNNRFACTDCYIKIGMPSSSNGWKAP